MAVKLRLQRKGRKKAPFYHIVVADARSPRDGRFIEKIGTYNPLTVPATIELDRDKAYDWLMKGAQPTDTVNAILRFKGVLIKKHLQIGVTKGAITQEQADAKLNTWTEEKENRIKARQEKTADKKREHMVAVDGKPKAKPKPPVVEAPPAEEAPAAEEQLESVSAPVEEAPTVMAQALAADAAAETSAPAAEGLESVSAEEVPTVAEATAQAIAESNAPDLDETNAATAEEAAPVVEEAAPVAEEALESVSATEEAPAAEEEAAPVAEAPAAEETSAPAEEEKATTEENTSEA